VTSILREELGFDGVVMTPFLDDVLIRNKYTPGFVAIEAVKAGCDMIVLSEDWKESYKALVTAVERGEIDEKVINTAVQRILQNKIQRGILVLEQ
jgi:beta-N-acetylhexosaminidase